MNNEIAPELNELKSNNLPSYCVECNGLISPERIEGLTFLETPKNQWTCLNCAETKIKPKMAVFLGESGNSPLLFVDKVDSHRVEFESVNRLEKSLTE